VGARRPKNKQNDETRLFPYVFKEPEFLLLHLNDPFRTVLIFYFGFSILESEEVLSWVFRALIFGQPGTTENFTLKRRRTSAQRGFWSIAKFLNQECFCKAVLWF
jgi:hypothetical protein